MSAKDSDEKDEAETTSPETPSTDSVSTTSNASSTHKVKGEFAESDGTAVLGTNTAGSGTPVGIEGSVPNGAAGKGVVGTSLDDDTAYVDWAEGFGVYGTSDRQYGVFGYKPSKATTTDGAAIFARSDTSDPSLWAYTFGSNPALKTTGDADIDGSMAVAGDQSVTGTSTLQGDTSVGGDLSIDGAQSVGDLGASVRLNGNQTVPDRTTTKVAFELVDADDRNEFSTSTHAFTTANPGDYQVNCTLNWAQWFSAGDYYAMYIYVDGSSVGHVTRNSPGDTVPGSIVLNRLLRDLPAGTEIDVRIYHTYGDTRSVGGGRATVLDIIQLG